MGEEAAVGAYVVVIIAMVVGVVFGVNYLVKNSTLASCVQFGQVSGRQTQFVEYPYWNYDCLTPGPDGKLISTSALRYDVK